jgi:hypothetical protein
MYSTTLPVTQVVQTQVNNKQERIWKEPLLLSRYSDGLQAGRPGFKFQRRQDNFSSAQRSHRFWGPTNLLSNV